MFAFGCLGEAKIPDGEMRQKSSAFKLVRRIGKIPSE